MFSFLRRLFRARQEPSNDVVVEEIFESDFSNPRKARFRAEDEARYSVFVKKGGVELALKRPRLFAWTENPVQRYSDFMLEGDIAFLPGAPLAVAEAPPQAAAAGSVASGESVASAGDTAKAAAGFLFRYADEGHFYSAMLSDSGQLRLDAIFNGTPRTLIAWTDTGAGPAERYVLTVIARKARICVMVNGLWAAEIDDDSYDSGAIAFGAENFGALSGFTARLEGLLIDSRPVEVETAYQRAQSPVFMKPRARMALAETFLAMGQPMSAAVHLKRMAQMRELEPGERFLLAEAGLRAGNLDEAAVDLDLVIEKDPGHLRAQAEKANVLYLQGRNAELREYLEALLPSRDGEASLWNLLGHARYALGEFAKAAEAYGRAAGIDYEQSIYALNAARSLDTGGDRAEAAEAYVKAARRLFTEDSLDDLALVVSRLEQIAPGHPQLAALRGKLLYREGRLAEAAELFEGLIAAGTEDSSVHYLEGLILRDRGKPQAAAEALRRACELEPEYPLYRFRLAETLFHDGRDAAGEIDRALALAPQDGWILNLAGQQGLKREDLDAARDFLSRAARALPGEIDPKINLSALLVMEGKHAEALACLSGSGESARALNQAGNVLCAAGDLDTALPKYDAAIRIAPEDVDVRLNRAACYIELDRFSDAEKDLRLVLEVSQDGRAYLLMGRLAEIYGDYSRAEVAYRAALENSPRDYQVMGGLAEVYIRSRRFPKAEEAIRAMEDSGHPRAEEFRQRLHELMYDEVACASCGRRWSTPKDLPDQGVVRISGELPDHSPAGSCPSCGKAYCVSCRKNDLVDGRLVCPDCRESLKLSDNRLKYLVLRSSGVNRS
jgi:tetratricopeptide (TPR) repeat protein